MPERRGIETHRVTAGGIHSHPHRHIPVCVLIRLNPVGRVQVEGGMQTAPVKIAEKACGVGEQVAVPAVARPASAVFRGNVGFVPIHVEHGDREGISLGAEPIHQGEVVIGGIPAVPAPPVAQRPARHHGRRTAKAVEIRNCTGIIVPVAEEIGIGVAGAARCGRTVLFQQACSGIVKPASPGGIKQTEAERAGAVQLIQCARCAHEVMVARGIAVGIGAVFPAGAVVCVAVFRVNTKGIGGKGAPAIGQPERLGGELQHALTLGDMKFGRRKIAAENRL